jgi:RHS repeat-associated protein
MLHFTYTATGQKISQHYPFGMAIPTQSFALPNENDTYQNRYLYNGKEYQDDFGLNWYDYGARFYDPQIARWHSVDPMAERYINESPYVYVGNRPTIMIDPDGMAYQATTDSTGAYTGFSWVDDSQAYDDDGNLKDGYFEKAILFSDNGTWSLGTSQNGRYVSYNIGSATATVYDYVETTNEDGTVTKSPTTSTYDASTDPSDPSAFGTILDNQLLQAVRHSHRGKYMALQMQTLSGPVYLPSDGTNPSSGTNYVLGGNIHKAGKNNFTGTFYAVNGYTYQTQFGQTHSTPNGPIYGIYKVQVPTYRYSGVSEACFLINKTQWSSFMNHFPSGVGRIGVINK